MEGPAWGWVGDHTSARLNVVVMWLLWFIMDISVGLRLLSFPLTRLAGHKLIGWRLKRRGNRLLMLWQG